MPEWAVVGCDNLPSQAAGGIDDNWIPQVQVQPAVVLCQYAKDRQLFGPVPNRTELCPVDVERVIQHELPRIYNRQRKIAPLDTLQPVQAAMFPIAQQQPTQLELEPEDANRKRQHLVNRTIDVSKPLS